MYYKKAKILASALAVALTIGGFGSTAKAATAILPSGGAELGLAYGEKLETVLATAEKSVANIEKQLELQDIPEDRLAKKESEEETFENLVIAQVSKYVNIRNTPDEKGEILGKLYNNSVGEFLGEENGWYLIESGSVTGYVKGEYCVTGEEANQLAKEVGTRFAKVTTTTLKVRSEATTQSACITLIPMDEELVITEETEGWAKVDVLEGAGWVSKDYIKIFTEFVHAESKEEEAARIAKEKEAARKAREAAAAKEKKNTSSQKQKDTVTYSVGEGSEMGKAVAEYGLQFVGNPYVYGGSSLTKGTDCSGFVMSVYANFGVSLPHSSAADRKQGYAVDGIENAQAGDIICYSGHVGIYIGDGQIVHASTPKTGIIVSSATTKKILAIRRIF